MSLQLPVAIERYIRIAIPARPKRPECFAPDAVVRDEGQTYEGLAAINNWMAATKKKYGHTITPASAVNIRDRQVGKWWHSLPR
jgi:hypothetical protein